MKLNQKIVLIFLKSCNLSVSISLFNLTLNIIIRHFRTKTLCWTTSSSSSKVVPRCLIFINTVNVTHCHCMAKAAISAWNTSPSECKPSGPPRTAQQLQFNKARVMPWWQRLHLKNSKTHQQEFPWVLS